MSSSTFAQCLAFTLRFEGGKVNDPRDPGGRTNQGVTQRTYEAYLERSGKTAVVENVYAMTPEQRDAIYREQFWRPIKGDVLDPGVDLAVFDFAVNSGPARALKAYGKRASNDGAAVVKTVCAARLSFLHALKTFQAFGRGWTARVAACEALGIKMAENARVGALPDAKPTSGTAARLTIEAGAARAKAVGRKKAAVVAPSAGAVPLAASQSGGVPWWALALVAAIGIGVGVYCAWRASIHSHRAAALTAIATGA